MFSSRIRRARYLLPIFFCILSISQAARSQGSAIDDISTLKARIIHPLLSEPVNKNKINQLLNTMAPQGFWPEIDYQDSTRSAWKTPAHLANIRLLALAYQSPDSPFYKSQNLKKSVLSSLVYWLQHDFQNPNWWWNVIGVPRSLGVILLTLEEELSTEQKRIGIGILNRAQLSRTGQNLIWVAEITANRGLLENDPEIVSAAYKRISDEIRITTEEGIQPDFSFFQHGACLYNHGYGAVFAMDCTRIASIVAGTQFAFPQDKIDILAGYILDGSQWMTRGSVGDYGADGREISRPNQTATYLAQAAENLLKLETEREKELTNLVARGEGKQATPIKGNKHFWRADFMAHQREGYYVSARMYSMRTVNTDGPHNKEGLKSHYIADGCNFLIKTGNEYKNIFPVWDWHKIPGTTVEQTGKFIGSPRIHGNRDFVGGISDGSYGLAAFDFERDGLQARKSWFFFDKEYMCLGAGITSAGSSEVITTINQCFLQSDVAVCSQNDIKNIRRGTRKFESPQFVYHNRVAYIFPQECQIGLQNDTRHGNWYDINNAQSKKDISADLFCLWIDHGKTCQKKSYSYIVLPDTDISGAKDYVQNPAIEILSNTPTIQAVRHKYLDLTLVAFYVPGNLLLNDGTTLAVDKPCLLMIHMNNKSYRFSISDPTQKQVALSVTISKELQGKACFYNEVNKNSKITFTLPTEGYAGQSIVEKYNIINEKR